MIVALAGGVGGARLANGLAAILPPDGLLVGVNVGDDFEHLGLTICPDIDTVTYTLAGLNDEARGWGIRDESWNFMSALRTLGGADWFALGDRDLAKHVLRTARLRAGESLSSVTADIARASGVVHAIVPVTDDPLRTMIETDEGVLPFQDYFVRRRCEPVFHGLHFAGAQAARPSARLLEALADPDLEAIVICPSNPLLSIAPILAVPGIANALRAAKAPCVAVSPFIGGEAIKGPAAKMLRELGQAPGAAALASAYAGIVDVMLCDHGDAAAGTTVRGIRMVGAETLMGGTAGQQRLARQCLAIAKGLSAASCA